MGTVLDLLPQFPVNDIQAKTVDGIAKQGIERFASSIELSSLQKDFTQAFDKLRQDPQLGESFNTAFVKEMKKDETRKFLERELASITDTVFRIKQDFEKVSATLLRFDRGQYYKRKPDGSSGGDRVGPLQPEWKKFQETFDNLLNKSKKTAEDGVYQAERYRKVILDMASTGKPNDMTDALKEVEGFIEASPQTSAFLKDIEKLGNNSSDLSTDFDRLRSEISSFKTIMQMAIQDTEENVTKEILEVESKIDEVKEELAKFQTTATLGWISTGVGVTVGVGIGVAAGLAIVAMTPIGWLIAAGAALAVVVGIAAGTVGEVKKVQLKNELKELENRLSQLTEQKADIETLKILFKKSEGQITDIANSINTISRIWSIFKLDANVLKKALRGATTDARTQSGLIRQVNMAKEQYEMLEANLRTYSTKMAQVEEKLADTK